MRPLFACLAFALLALPAQSAPQDDDAGPHLLRCRLPDGVTLYTDRACGAFDATSMPFPAEVRDRIARQQRYEARLLANARAVASIDGGLPPPDAESREPAVARRPVSDGCATTPRQLALDLQASVAMGDVNRVAESFDWTGLRHAQAHRILAQLERLDGVVEADYFSAAGGGLDDPYAPTPRGEHGLMQIVFDGDNGRRVADFSVRIDSGCYFLRYA